MLLHRVPREAMDRAHAEFRAVREAVATRVAPVRANVEPVLALGDTVYVSFRGRAFGVPPVGWKTGERLMRARHRAASAGLTITEGTAAQYFGALRDLSVLLWRHAHPVGPVRRTLKRLRLLRNPFADATDRELVDLADSFLLRRMESSVTRLHPARLPPPSSSTR